MRTAKLFSDLLYWGTQLCPGVGMMVFGAPGDGLRCPVFVRLELASVDVPGVLLNVGVPLLGKGMDRRES